MRIAKVAKRKYLYGPGLARTIRKLIAIIAKISIRVIIGDFVKGYSEETAVSAKAPVKCRYVMPINPILSKNEGHISRDMPGSEKQNLKANR